MYILLTFPMAKPCSTRTC